MEIKSEQGPLAGRMFIENGQCHYDREINMKVNEQLLTAPAFPVENKVALLNSRDHLDTMGFLGMCDIIKILKQADPVCKIFSARTYDLVYKNQASIIPMTLINHTPHHIAFDVRGHLTINDIRVQEYEFQEATVCAFQSEDDAKTIFCQTIPHGDRYVLQPAWCGASSAKVKEVFEHILKANFFFKAVWLPATDRGTLFNSLPHEILGHIWNMMIASSLKHRNCRYLT